MEEMSDTQTENEEWRDLLTEGHRGLKFLRSVFHHLPSEPRCKMCHNPFGGVGGKIVGVFGFKPSRKNPNFCSACCEKMPPGGAEVDIAIVFADIRGSTAIAEKMSSADYAELLNRFYRASTSVLINRDAVVDKLIGDEVMALFVPGMSGPDYRRLAAEAAVELLKTVGYGSGEPWLPIGVGVHAGKAYVGNVGTGVVDFTAVGDAVNTAARLQGSAQAGEVVMTEDVFREVAGDYPDSEPRDVTLRGREEPVTMHVVRVGA